MKSPVEVWQILRLYRAGYSPHRIAKIHGCSPATVARYVRQGQWRPRLSTPGRLDGLDGWIEERFFRHGGNATAVREELLREHGISVSPRTVQRAVRPLRRRLREARSAYAYSESGPGDQMQIESGSKPDGPPADSRKGEQDRGNFR